MNVKSLLTNILLMISVVGLSYSQDAKCKVLKAEISASYSGNCKKGLANGKGIAVGKDRYEGKFKDGLPNGNGLYTYANGEIYEGNFKNGMKHGSGKYTFKYHGKDSTYLGFWVEDKFVKKIIPPEYVIVRSSNVQRCAVQKVNKGNRVLFAFKQNGMDNSSISRLSFAESGGNPLSHGQEQGFDNIQFPFTCKISYSTPSKFKSTLIDVSIEIQINAPGEWLVTLHN
jgi:hypothetical protein